MVEVSGVGLSSGFGGLDRILGGLRGGENVVWQVDNVDNYRLFVRLWGRQVRKIGQKLFYFRFGQHESLMGDESGAEVVELAPGEGFEGFTTRIMEVIRGSERGRYFVFDCLSDLADEWFSDRMVSNFFRLMCQMTQESGGLSYFGLYRNYHSIHATEPITWATDLFLDVHRHEGRIYLNLIKVRDEHTAAMDMLQVWRHNDFEPVKQSAAIADVYTSGAWFQLRPSGYKLGIWNRMVMQAEGILESQPGEMAEKSLEGRVLKKRMIKMAITRYDRVRNLVERYLTLEEVLKITQRVIGTGLIGGKSVGMLLARAILEKTSKKWHGILERHDSFFIGSDVFYTFLVRNGIWPEREKLRDRKNYLEYAAQARQMTLEGSFPKYIEEQFNNILDYFGQFPFIVRSSSLLEDNFGNAFAGKYESVFCVNQGPREQRAADFLAAVRQIYASSMSEEALIYRDQRGLLDQDEQMALLVQRVSGAFYEELFLPQAAGVAFSHNPYVWDANIDPAAGVMRLAFGLGTRAVDRHDDEYIRIMALNTPERRPEAQSEAVRQYCQKRVDVLDLLANQWATCDFAEVLRRSSSLPIEIYASRDRDMERRAKEKGLQNVFPWSLTFDKLVKETDFVATMREMLSILQKAYDYPVDIEFTCNFFDDKQYHINLVQCRPFQVKDGGKIADPPSDIEESRLILQAYGAVIGRSRVSEVERFVYVAPLVYGGLPLKDRYTIARLIGKLMHVRRFYEGQTIMLLGPGRWGTTSPELGVPISFSEINTVSLLCEIVAMREDLVPDVSLGTHLFSEMVEMDILYMALFPGQDNNYLNREFFEESSNHLTEYLPEAAKWSQVLRVVEAPVSPACFNANTMTQNVVCYLS